MNNAVLFYNEDTGSGAIGVCDENTFTTTYVDCRRQADLPVAERQKASAIGVRVSLHRDDDLAIVSARAKMTKGFA
jgi:hypothetical protein